VTAFSASQSANGAERPTGVAAMYGTDLAQALTSVTSHAHSAGIPPRPPQHRTSLSAQHMQVCASSLQAAHACGRHLVSLVCHIMPQWTYGESAPAPCPARHTGCRDSSDDTEFPFKALLGTCHSVSFAPFACSNRNASANSLVFG
jgi:hypothetical protein